MSFSSRSSRSSNGRHYRKGDNGSSHYQKKGIFGNLFNMMGSRSGSGGNYKNQTTVNQNSAICSKCNSQIPNGSKFCLECGQKVNDVLHCMNCGEKLPPSAKFCLSCGKKINE